MPKHSTSNIQTALKNRKQGEAITFSQVWNVSFHESIIFRALPFLLQTLLWASPKHELSVNISEKSLSHGCHGFERVLDAAMVCSVVSFLAGLHACSFRMNETRLWELEEVLRRGEEEKTIVLKMMLPSKLSQAKPKTHHQPDKLWLVATRIQFVWYHFL